MAQGHIVVSMTTVPPCMGAECAGSNAADTLATPFQAFGADEWMHVDVVCRDHSSSVVICLKADIKRARCPWRWSFGIMQVPMALYEAEMS